MKIKQLSSIIIIVVVVALSVPAGIYAGTKVSDVIKFDNKAYRGHKESIVIFSHRKHQQEYREKRSFLFDSPCGECHHDDKNKPLVNLKEGDNVKRCIECHKKPQYITPKEAKKLSKEKKREYHANALHDNCKDCHKKFNKKFNKTSKTGAPASCNTCHPKKK